MVILKPTLEVEVAEAEMFRPAKVVVPNPVLETERTVVEELLETSSDFPPALPHTDRLAYEVDVPIARAPVKKDLLVVVEISDPTVSWEVVAIKVVPAASEVMMEFGAKDVALVPPFATGTVPSPSVKPEPPTM